MSIINYAQKEISFKVVYYGTGVAGKTANLQYIYRGLPDVNRGNMVSLATGDDRTLFFDFLPVSAVTVRNFVAKFQLYTVPGQVYYKLSRRAVLQGVDGVVCACCIAIRFHGAAGLPVPCACLPHGGSKHHCLER